MSEEGGFKVYWQRWVLCFTFSALGCLQCMVFNTFGPVSKCVERYYGWEKSTIDLFAMYGPIVFIPFSFIVSWICSRYGLRAGMLLGCFLITTGTALRLLDMSHSSAIYLVTICQMLNAAVGPVVLALPPVLSANWFPPHERTTATAITSLANSLGAAIAFALAPALVPDCDTISEQQIHTSLRKLYICHLAWAAAATVLAVTYFPSKPPTPPSESANTSAGSKSEGGAGEVRDPLLRQEQRHEQEFEDTVGASARSDEYDSEKVAEGRRPEDVTFGGAMREFAQVCTSMNFILLVATYGISAGVYCCWGSLLSIILKPKCCGDGTCPERSCFGESQSAYIGLSSTLCSVIGGVIAARVADRLGRSHKTLVVVCFGLAAVTFLVFTMSVEGAIPMDLTVVYVCVSLGGTFLASVQPMAYELAAEITFPVPEERSSTVLVIVYNAGALASMLAAQFIGATVVNWLLAITCAACGALMLLFKAEYKRSKLDE